MRLITLKELSILSGAANVAVHISPAPSGGWVLSAKIGGADYRVRTVNTKEVRRWSKLDSVVVALRGFQAPPSQVVVHMEVT